MDNKNHNGFTLIEVMIVVAILGIISAIALPSYTESIRKGKRTDAKVELLRIAQMQESYFVQNLSYAKILGATTATVGGLGLGATVTSEQQEYTIGITPIPSTCSGLAGTTACTGFTLSATPVTGKGQAGDKACLGFTLNNVGQKGITVTDATAADIRSCWK